MARGKLMRVKIHSKTGTRIKNLNRRQAIRERCLNCSGWEVSQVTKCEFIDCPLWNYRTAAGKQNPKARAKALSQYCLWCCAGQRAEVLKCPDTLCPLWAFRKTAIDRSIEALLNPETPRIEPRQTANMAF